MSVYLTGCYCVSIFIVYKFIGGLKKIKMDTHSNPKPNPIPNTHIRNLNKSSFNLFYPKNLSFFERGHRPNETDPSSSSCVTCDVCWWDHHPIDVSDCRRSLPLERNVVVQCACSRPVPFAKKNTEVEAVTPVVKNSESGATGATAPDPDVRITLACDNKQRVTYKFMGCFCSWECAYAWDLVYFRGQHVNIIRNARKDIDNVDFLAPLRRNPPPYILKKYGGTVSIDEFRNWWYHGDVVLDAATYVTDSEWIFKDTSVRILNNALLIPTPVKSNTHNNNNKTVNVHIHVDGNHHKSIVHHHRIDDHATIAHVQNMSKGNSNNNNKYTQGGASVSNSGHASNNNSSKNAGAVSAMSQNVTDNRKRKFSQFLAEPKPNSNKKRAAQPLETASVATMPPPPVVTQTPSFVSVKVRPVSTDSQFSTISKALSRVSRGRRK